MKRIITVLTVMAIMAAMMVTFAMPAFADPGNGANHSKSDCNAGRGNGKEFIHHGPFPIPFPTIECDPAGSVGNNNAGDETFLE